MPPFLREIDTPGRAPLWRCRRAQCRPRPRAARTGAVAVPRLSAGTGAGPSPRRRRFRPPAAPAARLLEPRPGTALPTLPIPARAPSGPGANRRCVDADMSPNPKTVPSSIERGLDSVHPVTSARPPVRRLSPSPARCRFPVSALRPARFADATAVAWNCPHFWNIRILLPWLVVIGRSKGSNKVAAPPDEHYTFNNLPPALLRNWNAQRRNGYAKWISRIGVGGFCGR